VARINRLVMAFGTFEILHPGHLSYFRSARGMGNRLIVVVARDSSVRAIKGREPAINERGRLALVKSLRLVDIAVLGNRFATNKQKYSIILKYKPDVVAIGYDQKVDVDDLKRYLKENGMRTTVVRIGKPYKEGVFKGSAIREKLAAGERA
jgi:FAD synthetase